MKLYLSPGACSLADHIALHEAGLEFDRVYVDLKAGRTDDGRDYKAINPKGYVPALELDDGQVLTENVAILNWVARQAPELAPSTPLGGDRLLEMLAFISTEIHKAFKPFFDPNSTPEAKQTAYAAIKKRLEFLAGRLDGDYLFGERFTVADAYLFTMLTWARKNVLPAPDPLPAYFARVTARPSVIEALEHEAREPAQRAA